MGDLTMLLSYHKELQNNEGDGANENIGQPIVVRSSIDNCNYLGKSVKQRKDVRKTRANTTAKSGITKLKRSDSSSSAAVTEIVISATAVSYR